MAVIQLANCLQAWPPDWPCDGQFYTKSIIILGLTSDMNCNQYRWIRMYNLHAYELIKCIQIMEMWINLKLYESILLEINTRYFNTIMDNRFDYPEFWYQNASFIISLIRSIILIKQKLLAFNMEASMYILSTLW